MSGHCFVHALLSVLSSFAIILTRKRALVALLLLFFLCLVTASVPWFFITVLCVSLQCVVVVLLGPTFFSLWPIFLPMKDHKQIN